METEKVIQIKANSPVVVKSIDGYELASCLAIFGERVSYERDYCHSYAVALVVGRNAEMSDIDSRVRCLPIEEVNGIFIRLVFQIVDEVFFFRFVR